MRMLHNQRNQQGAALVVGLILLVVITVLAISGMNTATTELAMARNDQNYENAFQAADTGLEQVLGQNSFNTLADSEITYTVNANDSVTSRIEFEESTLVPDKAFSLGVGSGVVAYHFLATAEAKSQRAGADSGTRTDRDSAAIHTQAFYIVGPEAPTL
jgi:type IV pilus assembly protein PilX